MLLEPDAVTGNRIEGRKRIIGSAKQPLSLLVNDDQDDVVGRFAGGPHAPHLAFRVCAAAYPKFSIRLRLAKICRHRRKSLCFVFLPAVPVVRIAKHAMSRGLSIMMRTSSVETAAGALILKRTLAA